MNDNNKYAETQKSPSGDLGVSIFSFVFNPVQENTYILWDETRECVIIDPGCFNEYEFILLDNFIKSKNLKPVRLINTHCHYDHIFGVEQCRKAYGLKWEAHRGDALFVKEHASKVAIFGISVQPVALPEIELNNGDVINFGHSSIKVIHVPGHSPGSVCFYEEKSKILISGDVLFNGSIGRTDLQGGDYDTLISGIKLKLLILPDEVEVFPGHGPSTTIGDEKAGNPYLH
jgi:hydroxyacylglutathione hydrolase